jgi:hypothetical protein
MAERTDRWQRATFGFRGQLEKWGSALRETWQTRSWGPLATQRQILVRKKAFYEQGRARPLCQKLSKAVVRDVTIPEPDGSTDWSLPARAETNRMPATTGLGR